VARIYRSMNRLTYFMNGLKKCTLYVYDALNKILLFIFFSEQHVKGFRKKRPVP